VLNLLIEGLSNPEICNRLVITDAAAKTHVARICRNSASVTDRVQVVINAYASGLVRPGSAGDREYPSTGGRPSLVARPTTLPVGTHSVSDRTRRLVGWAAACLALLLFATVPLSWSGGVASRPGVSHGLTAQDLMASIVVLSFAFSGAALVHARPRNWIGWILLAIGLLQAIQVSMDAYGARALTDPDGSLRLGLTSMWIASWTWLPAALIPITVLPAVYPTGHAPPAGSGGGTSGCLSSAWACSSSRPRPRKVALLR